jgi:hypothetical protein
MPWLGKLCGVCLGSFVSYIPFAKKDNPQLY